MDQEEFKRKLSEVADWEIPDRLNDSTPRPRKKRNAIEITEEYNEQDEQDDNEENFLAEFGGKNPTLPPKILKVHNQAELCTDCGRHCAEGRKKEKKLYEANKKKHWREKCITCGLTKNPFTGQFDLNSSLASYVWNDYCRDRKKPSRRIVISSDNHSDKMAVSMENDKEIIRFNPDINTEI